MVAALRYNGLRTDRGALQYQYRGIIESFGETVVCCGKGLNAEGLLHAGHELLGVRSITVSLSPPIGGVALLRLFICEDMENGERAVLFCAGTAVTAKAESMDKNGFSVSIF